MINIVNSSINMENSDASKSNKQIYQSTCLPMLKWAGGKRNLLKYILPVLPEKFNRYFEPFMGGGALFFSIQPTNSILSDTNQELINCYYYVREYPQEVISSLKNMKNTKADYYRIRDEEPDDDLTRAARIIYLTTLSFNGIYRQNLKGKFNVPYGYKQHLNPCDEERILSASNALQKASLFCSDFEEVLEDANTGDLIYLDPPYAISQGNGFVKYNSKIFTWDDQIRLSKIAFKLRDRGCNVVISNADVPDIRELYVGFECKTLERPSVIAASGEYRKKITECIFFSEV